MKQLSKLELSAEVIALIDQAKVLIEESAGIDNAAAQHTQKLKEAEGELVIAEQALAEADTQAALSIDINEFEQLDAAVATAKATVDAKRNVCERHKRMLENLKIVGRAHDEKIASLKSALQVELGIFSGHLIEQFEKALIEQLKPLVNLLAIGVAINRVLPSRNLSDSIGTRIESPTKVYMPIIRDGQFDFDGTMQPFCEYAANNKDLLAIQSLLAPIKETNGALGRYINFDERHRRSVPYVSRALDFRYPGSKKPTNAMRKPQEQGQQLEPQELNMAPGLAGFE